MDQVLGVGGAPQPEVHGLPGARLLPGGANQSSAQICAEPSAAAIPPSLEGDCDPMSAGGRHEDQDVEMVLEHAVLDVIPGQEVDFEEAFSEAKTIISKSPGFRALRLSRCVEQPSRYLLLVEWETLEDHTVGFRTSAAYEDWRSRLHHFYDPLPAVEHYESRVGVDS